MGSALLLSHLGTSNVFLVIVLLYHIHFCLIICLCLLSVIMKVLFWQQVVTGQGPTRRLHHRSPARSTLRKMVRVSVLGVLWQLTALRSPRGGWPELSDASSASAAGSRKGTGRYEVSVAFLPGIDRTLGFIIDPLEELLKPCCCPAQRGCHR